MRKLLALVPLAALALFAGCTTTGEPDITRIASGVKEAAKFGTEEALRFHPEWRPEFVVARDQISALLAADKLTVAELLSAIDRLPVKELNSDAVRIIIGAARLTVAIAGWSDVEIVSTAQVKPVGIALLEGLDSGLAAPTKGKPSGQPKYFKEK